VRVAEPDHRPALGHAPAVLVPVDARVVAGGQRLRHHQRELHVGVVEVPGPVGILGQRGQPAADLGQVPGERADLVVDARLAVGAEARDGVVEAFGGEPEVFGGEQHPGEYGRHENAPRPTEPGRVFPAPSR
jgi:hypothetical protein